MNLSDLGLNASFTSGLLTGTGAETVYDTTATINFAIDGVIYQKTAVTDGVTPTTDSVSGSAITLTANYARVVVWLLNSSGTVSVVAGDTVAWDGVAFAKAPPFPAIPSGKAPFAYSLLKGGSTLSGTWTFGSSNWNATGMTATHKNIACLPSRPVTS